MGEGQWLAAPLAMHMAAGDRPAAPPLCHVREIHVDSRQIGSQVASETLRYYARGCGGNLIRYPPTTNHQPLIAFDGLSESYITFSMIPTFLTKLPRPENGC